MLAETLIVSKNESLIFNDRSSGRGAKLIALKLRFGSSRLIKEIVRVKGAIAQKFKDASVQAVGAGLCDDRYLSSRPLPIFGAVSVFQDVELANCINSQQLPADAPGRYVCSGYARVFDRGRSRGLCLAPPRLERPTLA